LLSPVEAGVHRRRDEKETNMNSADPDGFGNGLARAASDVEARLEAHLQRTAGAGTPPRLLAAMRHGVLAGGKRFRPFLVLEFARLIGGPSGAGVALDVAAALECIHAYSLVHDDLPAMDNDTVRRGRPTVWKAYDEWTAILAGDALLTLAFEILAGAAAHPEGRLAPGACVALVGRLAAASGPGGMVGGQMLDLEAEKLGAPVVPDGDHVRRLQAMKTGALIAFACEAGAMAANAGPEVVEAARRYGAKLGLAFQISDDLLDVEGDAATVGKAVGKDMALGKATLVAVEGVEAARRELDAAVAGAIAALDGFGGAADVLRQAARFQLSRRH
jgi:farnesyl diphosphate synthase